MPVKKKRFAESLVSPRNSPKRHLINPTKSHMIDAELMLLFELFRLNTNYLVKQNVMYLWVRSFDYINIIHPIFMDR